MKTRLITRLNCKVEIVFNFFIRKGSIVMVNSYENKAMLNDAIEIAKKAGVKKLLLNHISARYTGKAAYQLAYQVRNIIPDTRVVNDFDVIDIPFKK